MAKLLISYSKPARDDNDVTDFYMSEGERRSKIYEFMIKNQLKLYNLILWNYRNLLKPT